MTFVTAGWIDGRAFAYDPDGEKPRWLCLECMKHFTPDTDKFRKHVCKETAPSKKE